MLSNLDKPARMFAGIGNYSHFHNSLSNKIVHIESLMDRNTILESCMGHCPVAAVNYTPLKICGFKFKAASFKGLSSNNYCH